MFLMCYDLAKKIVVSVSLITLTVYCYNRCIMCEFNVILNGQIQIRDVIFAKVDGGNVIVKNILGEAKEFKGCKIIEVDVPNARLVLSQA